MSDFPADAATPPSITTNGRYGVGLATRLGTGSTEHASAAWGTTNLGIYCPIWLPFRYPVRNLFVANGGTASGNFDLGIYTDGGIRIVSKGGTNTQTGTTTLQFLSVDAILDPGAYFLAAVFASATATVQAITSGTAGRRRQLGHAQQAIGSATLPATATLATYTTPGFLPLLGMTKMASPNF